MLLSKATTRHRGITLTCLVLGVFSASLARAFPADETCPQGDPAAFVVERVPTYGLSPEWQYQPSVAFDGTNYLVVWLEGGGDGYEIFGTRVSREGVVLDSIGLAISVATGSQTVPAAVYNGVDFLVVWQDNRGQVNDDIYAARVSRQGVVLDPQGFAVCNAAGHQRFPSVAFDGVNCLVVWQEQRFGSKDAFGARVTSDRVVLDPGGFAIAAEDSSDQVSPRVAYDGSRYLVVWADTRVDTLGDIYAARVTTSGTVLDTLPLRLATITGAQVAPAVAGRDNQFIVTWTDTRLDAGDVYAARVAGDGCVLDTIGIAVCVRSFGQVYPRASFVDTCYMIVWRDYRYTNSPIFGARVTSQGVVLEQNGYPVGYTAGGNQTSPEFCRGSGGGIAIWADYRHGNTDIYATRVRPDGAVMDTTGFAVSFAGAGQNFPAAAALSDRHMVVWQQAGVDGYKDVVGVRLSLDGSPLDTTAVVVSRAGYDQASPAVAAGSGCWLVAWADRRTRNYWDIFCARVTSEGQVLEPNGLAVSVALDDQEHPCVASDGNGFLVAWEDQRNGTYDLYAARVTADGTVLDPMGFPVRLGMTAYGYPDVAFDGSNYVITWQQPARVYCARVTTGGVLLDTAGIRMCSVEQGQQTPAIVGCDGYSLVVWEDDRPTGQEIYGARLSNDGRVLDPNGIRVTANINQWEFLPSVGECGAGFMVAWRVRDLLSKYDVWCAYVDSTGVVRGSQPIASGWFNETNPVVSRGAPDGTLVLYEDWANEVEGRTYHARRIWGRTLPFTGIRELTPQVSRRHTARTAIVRQSLDLDVGSESAGLRVGLRDVTGRVVALLRPGVNDLSGLSAGVYYTSAVSRLPAEWPSRIVVVR